jgi:hypothetical protein
MKITSVILIFVLAASVALTAEKYLSKPYTEWTENDVKNILTRSPWVKAGELSVDTGARASAGTSKGPANERTKEQEKAGEALRYVPYKVVWYTKIPRLAAIREKVLQKAMTQEDAAKYAQAQPEDAWRFALESQLLGRMSPEKIQEADKTTKLVRDDGAAVEVQKVIPGRQMMYFLFPLNGGDGKPFLTEQTKKFTFETEVLGSLTRQSFKVADCLVNGKLER